MFFHEVKWFCQRGWSGYSDLDVWGGVDRYLCDVLPDALRASERYGHPGQLTEEQWHRRIECMADGFEAAQYVMNRAKTMAEEERQVKRFKRGWLLMGRWFWWL